MLVIVCPVSRFLFDYNIAQLGIFAFLNFFNPSLLNYMRYANYSSLALFGTSPHFLIIGCALGQFRSVFWYLWCGLQEYILIVLSFPNGERIRRVIITFSQLSGERELNGGFG